MEGADSVSSFPLASMTTDLRVLTWLLCVLPVAFVGAGVALPPPVGPIMLGSSVFIIVVYASVWLAFRPTRFEVDGQALRIVWPLWARTIERRDVEAVRIITAEEFRSEHGYGMRIGAGGLWGGFGLLKTRTTMFSMWISRTDRFVIVNLKGARPLLVTPEQPEQFVSALGAS